MQLAGGQVGEAGHRVLAGVEHHGEVPAAGGGTGDGGGRGADRLIPLHQLVDHGGELGDVGFAARVGVPGQRDAAVPGHHQAQPGQAQIFSFLLCLAALGDRYPGVARAGEAGEIGHVQGHAGHVQAIAVHDPRCQGMGDLLQLLLGDRMHRIPEPMVIEHADGNLGEPVRGGGLPPGGDLPFRARAGQPVQRGQHQVAAHRTGVGAARPDHLVDQAGHVQLGQHPPGGRDRPEVQMPALVRLDRPLPAVQKRRDLGDAAHVPLRDHGRLAGDAGRLAQVVVLAAVYLLPVQEGHNLGSTSFP